jgi:hypothetical protein
VFENSSEYAATMKARLKQWREDHKDDVLTVDEVRERCEAWAMSDQLHGSAAGDTLANAVKAMDELRAEVEALQKALSSLIDVAHERRHSLLQQRFSDNDEGDAFARHRDSQAERISRIIDAAMAAKEGV